MLYGKGYSDETVFLLLEKKATKMSSWRWAVGVPDIPRLERFHTYTLHFAVVKYPIHISC
jgi:hypothetical protein